MSRKTSRYPSHAGYHLTGPFMRVRERKEDMFFGVHMIYQERCVYGHNIYICAHGKELAIGVNLKPSICGFWEWVSGSRTSISNDHSGLVVETLAIVASNVRKGTREGIELVLSADSFRKNSILHRSSALRAEVPANESVAPSGRVGKQIPNRKKAGKAHVPAIPQKRSGSYKADAETLRKVAPWETGNRKRIRLEIIVIFK